METQIRKNIEIPVVLQNGSSSILKRTLNPIKKVIKTKTNELIPNPLLINWWLINAPNVPSQLSISISGFSKTSSQDLLNSLSWSTFQVKRYDVSDSRMIPLKRIKKMPRILRVRSSLRMRPIFPKPSKDGIENDLFSLGCFGVFSFRSFFGLLAFLPTFSTWSL